MTQFDSDDEFFGTLDKSQCTCGKRRLVDSDFCRECEDEIEEQKILELDWKLEELLRD